MSERSKLACVEQDNCELSIAAVANVAIAKLAKKSLISQADIKYLLTLKFSCLDEARKKSLQYIQAEV